MTTEAIQNEEVSEEQVEEVKEVEEEQVEEEQEEIPEEKPEEPSETEEEKYSKKVQARIDKITKEKYDLRSRNKQLEEELKSYKERDNVRPSRPNMADFIDQYGDINHSDYNKAVENYEDNLLKWNSNQQASRNTVNQEEVEQEIIAERFQTAADIARVKYPDFDEVIERPVFGANLSGVLVSKGMAEVAYFLGNNGDEAKRISNLPEDDMLVEVGKLQEKLKTVKKPSNAPKPITPVDTSSGTDHKTDSDIEDDDEWFKKQNERRLANIKKGLEYPVK